MLRKTMMVFAALALCVCLLAGCTDEKKGGEAQNAVRESSQSTFVQSVTGSDAPSAQETQGNDGASSQPQTDSGLDVYELPIVPVK